MISHPQVLRSLSLKLLNIPGQSITCLHFLTESDTIFLLIKCVYKRSVIIRQPQIFHRNRASVAIVIRNI